MEGHWHGRPYSKVANSGHGIFAVERVLAIGFSGNHIGGSSALGQLGQGKGLCLSVLGLF